MLPDVQVGPLGGSLWIFIIVMAVVGLIFAPGLGAALAWVAFWAVVAIILFFGLRRIWLRLSGRRGGGRA